MSMRIYPTGEQDYIEEDRRRLIASGGSGNSLDPEVFLEFVDPATGEEINLGWFLIEDLHRLANKALSNYKNGRPI